MRRLTTLALVLAAFTMAGCASTGLFPAPLADPGAPAPTVTMARKEPRALLRCLGRQYEAFYQQPTLLALAPIKHLGITASYTAAHQIPLNSTPIMQSLLSAISPQVRHLDFALIPASVQQRFGLILSGGVTFDTASSSTQSSGNVGFSFGGFSFNYEGKTQDKYVDLEFVLNGMRGEDGLMGYGLSSSVAVKFRRARGDQHTIAASIASVALGADPVTREIASYGEAMELAFAHSLTVLLGRHWGLPYWQCTAREPDDIVKADRLQRFALVSAQGRHVAMQYLRVLLAYTGVLTPRDDTAIETALAARLDLPAEQPLDLPEAYWRLLLLIPQQSVDVLSAARRWETQQAVQPAAVQPVPRGRKKGQG